VLIYYCDFASVEVVVKNYLLTYSLLILRKLTSAVAERPRNDLCPSVVSFSSVIERSLLLVLLRLQIYHCLNAALLSSA